MPLDYKRCVRCNREVSLFEGEDAEYFKELLLREGIRVAETDVLCDDCVGDLVESQPEEAQ